MAIRGNSQTIALVALLALPWLNPWAPGPAPSVVPWLCTLGAIGLILVIQPIRCLTAQHIATAWLVAALLSCVIALCQYFGVEQWFTPWMNLASGQAYANLRQRNQFATLASIGLCALLWWSLHMPPKPSLRGAALAAAALLALGLAASSSRTGLFELLLIALLAGLWGWHRQGLPRVVLLVAVSSYAVAAWLLPWLIHVETGQSGILSRFQGDGCGSRLVLWGNVLELIAQRPWTGWGWGELSYAHAMHLYAGPRFCEILGNAHNLPLHLAAVLGVPLTVLAVSALLVWFLRQRPWREVDANRQLAWGVLAVLGLHSMLEYPLWYGPFLLAALLSLALLRRKAASAQPEAKEATQLAKAIGATATQKTQGIPIAQAVFAVLLLLAVAYAAWDYRRVSQMYLPPPERAANYREHTLEKVRASWLFADLVRFAEFSITPLNRENAAYLYALGQQVLHYSPEARIIEKQIKAAWLLGRTEEADFYAQRYRAAYAQAYARWLQSAPQAHNPTGP